MSDWFIIPAKVILFVLSDSFFVPAGILLILTVSITLVVRLILKIKKEGWAWKSMNTKDASFDTSFSSSYVNSSLDRNDIYTNPAYSSLSVNIYNQDRWKSY